MPEIASDGIQVIDVTDFSIRIGEPSLPTDVVTGKAKPAGPPGLVRTERVQSVAERRPRRNANAPATAAITTAISDLFGLPPSTDGVTSRAFFLPARFATFQTAQPMAAFRLLITLTRIAYPHRPRPNQRKKKSGAGGRARPRNGTRAHPASLEAVRAENLQRVRNGDQSHSPKRRPLLSLEAGEACAPGAIAQMRAQPPALSPGESPVQVARDRRLCLEAVRRSRHCTSRC